MYKEALITYFKGDYLKITKICEEFGFNVKLYNKGNKDLGIKVKNIGVDVYDKFHFLVNNYHNLPDLLLFLTDTSFDDIKKKRVIDFVLENHYILYEKSGFLTGHIQRIKKDDIDFAFVCTYKYICGGPGSPAFIYVNPKHINKINPIIAGWLGHENPFNFDLSYKPAKDIKRFRIGTPPVIQMSALEEVLKIWETVDIDLIRKEAISLTSLFINKINNSKLKLSLISPKNPKKRGNQVAYKTENAYEKMQALIDLDVIGDYREPNIMRFGFNPLYNSEDDVIRATEILKKICNEEIWKKNKFH